MKKIKDYIQFAIDNGYPIEHCNLIIDAMGKWTKRMYVRDIGEPCDRTEDYLNILTSKSFIESTFRGIEKTKNRTGEVIINWEDGEKHYHFNLIAEGIYYGTYKDNKRVFIRDLTMYQAIAIRDNKLEEFITNLLTND